MKVTSINNRIPQGELEPLNWYVSGSYVVLEYSVFSVVYNDSGREIFRIANARKQSFFAKLRGWFK